MADKTDADGEKGEGDKKATPPKAPLNTTNLLLMVVLAVLILLIVGGAVGAIVLYRSAPRASVAAQPTADAPASDEKGDKAKDGDKQKEAKQPAKPQKEEKPKAPAIYVTLEPPFVVNFKAGKPAKFLQITMEIMTREQNAAQVMKENNPLLRNDLLMLFGGQDYETMASPEGREALRAKALEAARGVVKKEGGKPQDIEAVYFTSLVMQ
ncbi:MAG TPA: flagellar basal body-associated FliL family protein [Steroidobacteraceae bacterium]|nr:flagellar basal body-associated FliL family protein [Steroidobacteraceae bacterium]